MSEGRYGSLRITKGLNAKCFTFLDYENYNVCNVSQFDRNLSENGFNEW